MAARDGLAHGRRIEAARAARGACRRLCRRGFDVGDGNRSLRAAAAQPASVDAELAGRAAPPPARCARRSPRVAAAGTVGGARCWRREGAGRTGGSGAAAQQPASPRQRHRCGPARRRPAPRLPTAHQDLRQSRLPRRPRSRWRPSAFRPRPRRRRARCGRRASSAIRRPCPSPCPRRARACGSRSRRPHQRPHGAGDVAIVSTCGSAASSRCLAYGIGTSAPHTRSGGASSS